MHGRHAAQQLGLALLTWVLLQPPVRPTGEVVVDAPLGDWVSNGQFPTQEECENTHRINQAALAYAESRGGGSKGAAVITRERCLSVEKLRELLAPVPTPEDD